MSNYETFVWKLLGIDRQLSRHVAHLFTRDPLTVYKEMLDDDKMDHFDMFNTTNYQSVRFKPPPPDTDMGWRVEMRPIEVIRKLRFHNNIFYKWTRDRECLTSKNQNFPNSVPYGFR